MPDATGMRILVAIPHYLGPPAAGGAVYGSAQPAALDIVVVVIRDRHALAGVALPPTAFGVAELSLDEMGGDPRCWASPATRC
jgi:hypothetical protein